MNDLSTLSIAFVAFLVAAFGVVAVFAVIANGFPRSKPRPERKAERKTKPEPSCDCASMPPDSVRIVPCPDHPDEDPHLAAVMRKAFESELPVFGHVNEDGELEFEDD